LRDLTDTVVPKVAIVDDDRAVRDSLRLLLDIMGYAADAFESAANFPSGGCSELRVEVPITPPAAAPVAAPANIVANHRAATCDPTPGIAMGSAPSASNGVAAMRGRFLDAPSANRLLRAAAD
jgi:DNA-binding NtrC family response regulator